VLLAGDAAHVHGPTGGQGMGTGIQDAVNLGWKLGRVVHGTSPASLLDTYHAERHPVGARVLRTTMALTAFQRGDDRVDALREWLTDLMDIDAAHATVAARLSGLDIRYDLGDGHPLVGRRMPDLDVVTPDGPLRVYELLHDARPVLLAFGGAARFDAAPWDVPLVEAGHDGPWELPVVGTVAAPGAVLVRPDGYVAWAGELADPGLRDALTTWFGPPRGE
jgi:3-(3-hydroxy-phenyl)propionate hydroxylase